MSWGKNLTRTGIFLAAVAFGAAPGFAQSENAGLLLFTTGVDIDTNKDLDAVSPGTTTTIYERLKYSYRRETRSQLFEFSAGTQLEFNSLDGSDATVGLNENVVRFLYSKSSLNSDLQFDGSYNLGDVTSAFDSDPTDASLIGVGDGTILRTNTNFSFQTGLNDPIGFWVDAGYQTRGYYDSNNPSNVDSITTTLGAGASFRVSGRTEATISFVREDYQNQANLAKRVETNDLTFGLSHELRSALVLYADLGHRTRETSILGGNVTEAGHYGSLEFVQERPNGTIFGGIGFDNTRFLDELSVNFGRTLDLPDGSLSANIELTNIERVGLEVFGGIDYVRTTPTGALEFNISRSEETDENYRDIIFSSVGIGYQHQINTASNFRLSLDWGRTEDKYFAAIVPVRDRATFTASYSRAVTPQWNMNVGYRHREYTADINTNTNSDAVFLTMTRDIEFGF